MSGAVADRYTIEGELGRGGTAIVYRARDRVRGIDVAIKLLREDAMGAMSVERFLLEIRNTAKLPHPHIVPVLDSGQHDGRPYFVLPYMDGGTLRERLVKHKQLPFEEVIALGVTISRALEFAHAHGVIHRDVKPENILYNNGQPCLADFGTARAMERAANDPTTSTGVVRGTAAYMSPEQASGERNYDGRTDIYSLACVLYECVAGIQPFVGPTLQAVISQRLSHAPRPVSVYRPSVPPALEEVLVKATAMAPADRFQRAGELAGALEQITPTLTNLRVTSLGSPRRTSRARQVLVGLTAIAALAIAAFLVQRSSLRALGDVAPDTTRVAILPFEVTGAPLPYSGEDVMYEGFRHWTGLHLNETYETRDALRRIAKGEDPRTIASRLTGKEAEEAAKSIGAGRYVRGMVLNTLGRPTVRASIYDVSSSRPLYEASLPIGPDVIDVFASLADSLVLRAQGTATPPLPHGRVSNAPSMQLFLRGREQLDEWNLSAADSLFALAEEADPTNVRAELWRVQIRSWRGLYARDWGPVTSLVSADTISLSQYERSLATALHAIAAGEYARACAAYSAILRERPNDFAGWYGLGECRRQDRVVIRDARSPSHWRFRSSYEQAIQSYRRALQLLPVSYKALHAGGYDQLRSQLYTDPQFIITGTSADSQIFGARPELDHDTVAFIARPLVETLARLPDSIGWPRAIKRNRDYFAEIAQSWSTALPRSVGAKEAFAVALEMVGDPAAADSFASAALMASDGSQRLRLAVNEALMRVKLGVSGAPLELGRAVNLIDSILSAARAQNAADHELLARIAAVTGRCRTAAEHAMQTGTSSPQGGNTVPPFLTISIDSAFVAAASGCEDTKLPEVSAQLIRSGVERRTAVQTEVRFLSPIVAARYPADLRRVKEYAPVAADFILTSERMLAAGARDSARALLRAQIPFKRVAMSGNLGPDAAYTEAKLWLALGDTATATWLLDTSIAGLRFMQPMKAALLLNTLHLGAIGLATNLRASIQRGGPESPYKRATEALWRGADPTVRAKLEMSRSVR